MGLLTVIIQKMARKYLVAVDLDGVIIDKPLLVPKRLIELLFRGRSNKIHYRYPNSVIEQLIRKVSHFYLFRPPIAKNIEMIKKMAKLENTTMVVVSSRYSFLEKETYTWLKKRKLEKVFSKIYLNLQNQQPHLYKETLLKKIKADYFLEDDQLIIDYLNSKKLTAKIIKVNYENIIHPNLLPASLDRVDPVRS